MGRGPVGDRGIGDGASSLWLAGMTSDPVGGQGIGDGDGGLQLVFVLPLNCGVLILLQFLRCFLSVPSPICPVAREPPGYLTSHNTNE